MPIFISSEKDQKVFFATYRPSDTCSKKDYTQKNSCMYRNIGTNSYTPGTPIYMYVEKSIILLHVLSLNMKPSELIKPYDINSFMFITL